MLSKIITWLTVITLITTTMEINADLEDELPLRRLDKRKPNILEDLMFMGINQLEGDMFSKFDLTKVGDGGLMQDILRVFDGNPREVVGLNLPINPIPVHFIQIIKFAFAFMPIDIDPLINTYETVGGLTQTMQTGYTGVSFLVKDLLSMIPANLTRTYFMPTVNKTTTVRPTPTTTPKPKPTSQTITETGPTAGDAAPSLLSWLFGKGSKANTTILEAATTSKPTTSKVTTTTAQPAKTETTTKPRPATTNATSRPTTDKVTTTMTETTPKAMVKKPNATTGATSEPTTIMTTEDSVTDTTVPTPFTPISPSKKYTPSENSTANSTAAKIPLGDMINSFFGPNGTFSKFG